MPELERRGERIGAALHGIDVRTLDDAGFAAVNQAWLDAEGVLVIPGQHLTIPEFLAHSRRFGAIVPHPSKSTRHPEHPEITLLGINKFRADGTLDQAVYRRGAEDWHTDGAYDHPSFKATQLYALAIPSEGGDTHFASGYAAAEALPASLRARLEGVRGAFVYGGRRRSVTLLNPEDRDRPPAFHKILRRHPDTGRVSLYFDPGKILYLEGMAAADSDALIEELTDRMIQPGATYRHRWAVGDIVIWDNRCAYHRAAGDYPPEQDRIHWRVTIAGTATV